VEGSRNENASLIDEKVTLGAGNMSVARPTDKGVGSAISTNPASARRVSSRSYTPANAEIVDDLSDDHSVMLKATTGGSKALPMRWDATRPTASDRRG
jgi:hypothetical protein